MSVVYEDQFKSELRNILSFIARDKKSTANKFAYDLKELIETTLARNPKMYKVSLYFSDENYHDMVFKGYTIIYKMVENEIRVLDVFKWQIR